MQIILIFNIFHYVSKLRWFKIFSVLLLAILLAPIASRDNNTECDNKGKYKCGDKFISRCTQCFCGEHSINFNDWAVGFGKLCCPQPGNEECDFNYIGDVRCDRGLVIENFGNLRTPNFCDYAHFSCDNKTVNKYNICHGSPICYDGTDLEQCSTLICH